MKQGVSLYSYQMAYAAGKMNLEDCFKAIKALPDHADGVEILADRAGEVPQMPYKGTVNQKDQETFKELMQKYELKATVYDSSLCDKRFPMLVHHTNPDKEILSEQIGWLKNDIDFAGKLGFSVVRCPILYGFFDESIEEAMRYCSSKGMTLCMEVHAPLEIQGEYVSAYVDMIERVGVDAGGLIPDFGLFQTALPAPLVKTTLNKGGDSELVKRICETFSRKGDLEALEAEVKTLTDNAAVQYLARYAKGYVAHKPEDMKAVAKYVKHVHAKFYEVDENYVENGIDFEAALKTLTDMGYDEYLNSEYEGMLFMDPAEVDEVEQVRRQHVMTSNMLKRLG